MMRPVRIVLHWLVAAFIAATAASCASRNATSGTRGGSAVRAKAAPSPSLVEHVPDGAAAALVLRRPVFEWLRRWTFDDPSLRAELGGYLERTVGIDLTHVDGLVAFVRVSQVGTIDAAALFTLAPGTAGTLRGAPIADAEGTPLVDATIEGVPLRAARVPAGLVVGTESGVRTAIALEHKHAPPIDRARPIGAALERGAEAVALLCVDAKAAPPLALLAAPWGIERAALYLSESRLWAEALGVREKLGQLKQRVDEEIAKLLGAADEAKAHAMSEGKVLEGVATILTQHHSEKMLRRVTPMLDGDRLYVDVKFADSDGSGLNAMVVTGVAGVLAAIAIPSFVKYKKRSQTSEARSMLHGLERSIMAWHMGQGDPKRVKFPPSTDWSPKGSCCAGKEQRCAAQPQDFAVEAWKTFGFNVDVASRYQFRYAVTGAGRAAKVVLEARGDTDCNGKFAMFRIEGKIASDGALVFEPMTVQDENE
jgi:hypothetical protein